MYARCERHSCPFLDHPEYAQERGLAWPSSQGPRQRGTSVRSPAPDLYPKILLTQRVPVMHALLIPLPPAAWVAVHPCHSAGVCVAGMSGCVISHVTSFLYLMCVSLRRYNVSD